VIPVFTPPGSPLCRFRFPLKRTRYIQPVVHALAMILLLAGLLTMGSAGSPARAADQEIPPSGGTTKVDQYQEKVSQVILNSADWMDSFFRTDTYESESNKTRIKVRLDAFSEEGEGTDFKARFDFRLNLPGTENRLNLLIGHNSDDDSSDEESPGGTDRHSFDSNEDDDVGMALEYFFRDDKFQNIKLSGGVRWRDSSLVLWGGPRHRKLWDLGIWDVRMENRVRYYTDEGFDYRLRTDFERPVPGELFLRIRPEFSWYESESGVFYKLQGFLYHPLSRNRALEYQFNNYFESDLDSQLAETNLRVRYRQRIWRDWLTLEVAPQVAWYEEQDYHTTLGILVRLEGWFGRWKKEKIYTGPEAKDQ